MTGASEQKLVAIYQLLVASYFLLDIALSGVVIEVETQRQVRTVEFRRQRRERDRSGNSAPRRAIEGDIA